MIYLAYFLLALGGGIIGWNAKNLWAVLGITFLGAGYLILHYTTIT